MYMYIHLTRPPVGHPAMTPRHFWPGLPPLAPHWRPSLHVCVAAAPSPPAELLDPPAELLLAPPTELVLVPPALAELLAWV